MINSTRNPEYKMPPELFGCIREGIKPEYLEKKNGSTIFFTYYCPICGLELHSIECKEHAALKWNNHNWMQPDEGVGELVGPPEYLAYTKILDTDDDDDSMWVVRVKGEEHTAPLLGYDCPFEEKFIGRKVWVTKLKNSAEFIRFED